jgi:hypothetical protein
VADEPYRSATALPVVDTGTPVTIEAKIANDTASSQTVRVLWEIYQWDAQLRENVVQEESRTITVPSHSSAPISITVTDTEYPAYLAVGKLDWKDTSSIVNVRFARDGVDRARINFPGTLSFPLTDGQPNGVFSCLHDSGEYDIPSGGRLDLRLLDRDSNIIHEYHYEGGISSAMMGLLSEFTPKKNYDYVLLNARLSQDGEFVDEVTLIYDCMRIDPSQCRGESGGDWSALPLDILVKAGPILLLVGVVLVTFIVLLAILKYLNRAAARPPEPPSLDNL